MSVDDGRLDRRDARPVLAAPLPDDVRPRLGRERAPRRLPQERELVARPRAEERERPRLADGGPRGHRGDRARAPPRAPALRVGPGGVRRTASRRRPVQRRLARLRRGRPRLPARPRHRHGARRRVNPDFGQVEVDPAVVNLTAFETFYEEKRPFFTEGSQVFLRFGRSGASEYTTFFYPEPQLFYSRRIGRAPQGAGDRRVRRHADRHDHPGRGQAGRAARRAAGTSGVLEAVTGREYAQVATGTSRDSVEVEPLTNYFVGRAQHAPGRARVDRPPRHRRRPRPRHAEPRRPCSSIGPSSGASTATSSSTASATGSSPAGSPGAPSRAARRRCCACSGRRRATTSGPTPRT